MADRIAALPRKPISRIVTAIMDHLPVIGKIKKHEFATTLGAGVTFTRAEDCSYEGFYLSVNACSPVWTSQELRELADECMVMAQYLEKLNPAKATTESVAA